MALTIRKFVHTPGEPVMAPSVRQVLSAHAQNERICIWMEVDPDTPLRPRRFNVYGDEAELPLLPGRFVGTALLDGGSRARHVYEAEA